MINAVVSAVAPSSFVTPLPSYTQSLRVEFQDSRAFLSVGTATFWYLHIVGMDFMSRVHIQRAVLCCSKVPGSFAFPNVYHKNTHDLHFVLNTVSIYSRTSIKRPLKYVSGMFVLEEGIQNVNYIRANQLGRVWGKGGGGI